MKKFNIEEFEFSQSYLFFWDKVGTDFACFFFCFHSSLVKGSLHISLLFSLQYIFSRDTILISSVSELYLLKDRRTFLYFPFVALGSEPGLLVCC
jgi:hypothetical protein